MIENLSSIEKAKLKEIVEDPVLWARVFVKTFDPATKRIVPWEARWYQAKMLRDKTLKKVARCGRRTGKSETMCVDSLWRTYTKPRYRCLFVTPYENQIRLIFTRLRELIDQSPYLKREVVKMTMNPYCITWRNGSMIIGFTTGASSGSAAASIRGQRADFLYLDEMDYMGPGDFDTVAMIAAERPDIGMFCSSTPTGKRSHFYQLCTNKKMGYTEYHYPSTCNPSWCPEMEAEFREQLSEQGFVHEIMAEFGTEEAGVFPKEKIDAAQNLDCYAYKPLDVIQQRRCAEKGLNPTMYIFKDRAPMNPFRTMGVDFDKYKASSSIVILDFDVNVNKFRVMNRIEVPRAEYSYDAAVNLIVSLNEQYLPSWIYCDRGSGEYQIERLHILGDQRPSTGLKNKVKGWQFSQTLEVIDPVSKMRVKEPMKPFMVNRLTVGFERERIILSPFDDGLAKQLIDYRVERLTQAGVPVFSDENEHSIDALGLAFLAFVLEFPDLAGQIKTPQYTSKMIFTSTSPGSGLVKQMMSDIQSPVNKELKDFRKMEKEDRPGDRPTWMKIPLGAKSTVGTSSGWGSRQGGGGFGRKTW